MADTTAKIEAALPSVPSVFGAIMGVVGVVFVRVAAMVPRCMMRTSRQKER